MTPDQMYLVADSLFTAPHEWTADEYKMKHRTGLALWISNGPAHFRLWEVEPSDYQPHWRWKAHYRYLRRAVEFRKNWGIDRLVEGLR